MVAQRRVGQHRQQRDDDDRYEGVDPGQSQTARLVRELIAGRDVVDGRVIGWFRAAPSPEARLDILLGEDRCEAVLFLPRPDVQATSDISACDFGN